MLYLVLGVILGALIYYKIYKPINFWAERDIPHEHPTWPIFGNLIDFARRKRHLLEIILNIYKKYPDDRYVGYLQFTTPALMIRDLDLIKQIGVKEFDGFHDHLPVTDASFDPLFAKALLNLRGDEWRKMRATLSPAFTSSKLKNMHHLIAECCENFVNHFKKQGEVELEIKELLSRFANDVIASTAFGIQIDSINNPDNEFLHMGKKLTDFDAFKIVKMLLTTLVPRLAKLLNIETFDKNNSNFFSSIIMENIQSRTKKGIVRPDLIHLLMEAQKGRLKHETNDIKEEGFAAVEESSIGKSTTQMKLTDEHIVAQALLFFFAGFETISTASSSMAYQLAVNPDIQKKLQEEIDDVKKQHGKKVPHDAILSMKYLDQVVCESLRLWPPAAQVDRLCNKDYTVVPKNPKERTFVIEKDVMVTIPVIGLHRDPQYFPDPDRFDPERFSDENKTKVISGSYLPFGIGPRNCIGSRFALLEIKTLFFHILSNFEIAPNSKTEIPFKISPKNINLCPENGFQLTLKPREVA